MRKYLPFVILTFMATSALFAAEGVKLFKARESLSDDKNALSDALSEYEAQQARFEAEIEKRKTQEREKIRIAHDKSGESFDEIDVQDELMKKAELEKRRAEIERKTRDLEEKKAIVRKRKEQIKSRIGKGNFVPQEANGEEIMETPAQKEEEISDDELEIKATESEERRMNPVLLRFVLPADYFSKKGYGLTQSAKNEIKKYASQIKKLDYRKITVEGHSDSLEDAAEAKKLSRLRAKAVYDELIENEISVYKSEYVGLSDKIREETNETKKGRRANRRTEIFVE
jgi:outer membrane protein OmpA-like peptidoglycan-associated protein